LHNRDICSFYSRGAMGEAKVTTSAYVSVSGLPTPENMATFSCSNDVAL